MTTELASCTTETCSTDTCCSTAETSEHAATFTPRVDILETPDELLIYGDLPGVAADGLDIHYENKELSIQGKAPLRREGEFMHREYKVGDFRRVFTLSEAIDAGKISAELKDGVLTVRLPKSEEAKPRKIPVKVE